MAGKSSPRVQGDTVTITVSRQQAKDLIVALAGALQSGGGKAKDAVADGGGGVKDSAAVTVAVTGSKAGNSA